MIWGKDDCLTDILGDEAHHKIGWVESFQSHNHALAYIASLPVTDRWKLLIETAKGQGWEHVYPSEKKKPGDVGIGAFSPSTGGDIMLLLPWFAVMQVDHLWYVRMPNCYRVVAPKNINVYRCPPQP